MSLKSDRVERAKRAVSIFRGMQPGLTGYARAITGNKKITVEITDQGGFTDGKKIYFKPPIALGDMTPHDRAVCDRRDKESLHLLCAACRVREEVLTVIYHEIAHNVFGTFVKPTSQAKARAVEAAIDEVGTKYAQRVKDAYSRLPDYAKDDYINLANIASPFLPKLINAIEDARVDEQMFQARRGTKVMFDAMTQGIFSDGFEEADGSKTLWSARPLNSQIIIGVFVLACEYDYKGWFHSDVEKALDDTKLTELSRKCANLSSVHESYNLGFKILARLRELGFCLNPNEPQDEDDEQEEQHEDQVQQPEPDKGDEEGDSDPEAADEEALQGDSDSRESGDEESESGSDEGAGDDVGNCGEHGEDDSQPPADAGDGGDASSDRDADGDDSQRTGSPEDEDEQSNGSPAEGHDAGHTDVSKDEAGSDTGASGSHQEQDTASDQPGVEDLDDGMPGASEDEGPEAEAESSEARPEGELTDDEAGNSGREDREGSSSDDMLDGSTAGGDDSTSDDSESSDGPEFNDLEGIEPVDSGADEGEGGESSERGEPRPEAGTPEQVAEDLQVFTKHDMHGLPEEQAPEAAADSAAITQAIVQGLYFETSSTEVTGVRESKYQTVRKDGTMPEAWIDRWGRLYGRQAGIDSDMEIPEQIIGPALLEMRRVFSDNQRAAMERHLCSGKINKRVLGKRAWSGDERLFQKKRLPGKKSYAVVLGIDVSASTIGLNIALAKRAAMAQAELLHRAGIKFAIYAHSANNGKNYADYWLDVYEIKSFEAPWGVLEHEALEKLGPVSENLDGHTIEFYRKLVERQPETDKVILYYSDGKMPAANHDEELEILQREIAYCKRHKITLLGVGIRTDSPRRHGLDTVQVDNDSDMIKVVRHLKNALLHNR